MTSVSPPSSNSVSSMRRCSCSRLGQSGFSDKELEVVGGFALAAAQALPFDERAGERIADAGLQIARLGQLAGGERLEGGVDLGVVVGRRAGSPAAGPRSCRAGRHRRPRARPRDWALSAAAGLPRRGLGDRRCAARRRRVCPQAITRASAAAMAASASRGIGRLPPELAALSGITSGRCIGFRGVLGQCASFHRRRGPGWVAGRKARS